MIANIASGGIDHNWTKVSTETKIGCNVLNRMTTLSVPTTVRIR